MFDTSRPARYCFLGLEDIGSAWGYSMRGSMKTVVACLLVCGLFGGGCLDVLGELLPDDGFGLNHDFDSAYDITGDEATILFGSHMSYPEDYFVVTVSSSPTTLTVTCTPDSGDDADIDVRLYYEGDPPAELTPTVDDTPGDSTFVISYLIDGSGSAPIGDYYIVVEYLGTSDVNGYELTWAAP
jgi:hypothetical protein